jgi:hypothetical protein
VLILNDSRSLLLTLICYIVLRFLALSLRVARVFRDSGNNVLVCFVVTSQALISRFGGGVSVKIFAKRRTCLVSVTAIAILISFSPNRFNKAICSSCFYYIRESTSSFNSSPSFNLSCFSSSGVGLRRRGSACAFNALGFALCFSFDFS